MSDENSLSGTDDFKNLQKRLNHESIRNQFRLKLVGGLNQDDVTAYIENIENKFHKLEQENKNVSDNIYSLKRRLNEELEDKDNLQVSLNKTQKNLDIYIVECKNKELIIQSLNEKGSSKTAQLQNEIHQMAEERKELETLLSESVLKIENMKEYASGFEKDKNEMETRIIDLEKENSKTAQLHNEIHQMAEDKKELEELLTESGSEIEQMKKYNAVFEKDNNEMKMRIVDLEKEISYKNIQNYEINRTCHNLEQQIELEKSCNEKHNMDLAIFRQNITSLEKTISENLTEIKELKKISLKAEQELNLEKARVLNYKIYGFKEEFSSIYEKIENLADEADHQVKTNKELQQQLIIEQLRSDKAENDLKSFIKLLNGLKDKVSGEQNPFETQLKEITEKRYQLQPEINDWLIKLQ